MKMGIIELLLKPFEERINELKIEVAYSGWVAAQNIGDYAMGLSKLAEYHLTKLGYNMNGTGPTPIRIGAQNIGNVAMVLAEKAEQVLLQTGPEKQKALENLEKTVRSIRSESQ